VQSSHLLLSSLALLPGRRHVPAVMFTVLKALPSTFCTFQVPDMRRKARCCATKGRDRQSSLQELGIQTLLVVERWWRQGSSPLQLLGTAVSFATPSRFFSRSASLGLTLH